MQGEFANMKKVLILSYHYLPMNVISSNRAKGYADHFSKFGLRPTILTFDWSKSHEDQIVTKDEFKSRITKEQFDDYEVVRLPVLRNDFLESMKQREGSFLYKLYIMYALSTGNLDVDPKVLAYAQSEEYYLKNFLNQKDYHFIMGIFSPHFHHKNCYMLHKEYGIPYALDYRDLWDNTVLSDNYQPEFSLKVRDFWVKFYWKKYAKDASFLSIVGSAWVNKLKEVTGHKKVLNVFNGFDNELPATKEKNNTHFQISYTGSFYPWQDYKTMVSGIKHFLEELSNQESELVKIKFLGVLIPNRSEGISDYIKEELNFPNVEVLPRAKRSVSLEIQKDSDILMFATAPKVKGVYSGKIFEYISSGSLIFIGSRDDTTSLLVEETGTGEVYDSPEELKNLLLKYFNDWHAGKVIRPDAAKRDLIKSYCRLNQTEKIAKQILTEINSNTLK